MYPTSFSRTTTYTKTDVQHVLECFQADVLMLVMRTQALDIHTSTLTCIDVSLMAYERCISKVHIQLLDRYGRCVRAHEYNIHENVNWNSQRPSDNRWPCLPDGRLAIIVEISNWDVFDQLTLSGQFELGWEDSILDTNYSNMRNTGERKYASSSYGWQRNSYSIF